MKKRINPNKTAHIDYDSFIVEVNRVRSVTGSSIAAINDSALWGAPSFLRAIAVQKKPRVIASTIRRGT